MSSPPRTRYSRTSRRLWNDDGFRSLSAAPPNAQTLWLRLLTGPELTNIPGIIPAWEAGLAQALRWPLEGFREAFREVSAQGMAEADWEAGLVWVPNAIAHNRPESPNVVKSWLPTWDVTPECELKTKAYHELKAFVEGMGLAFAKAFAEACAEPYPKPSGNQEQEQEQEQEQDHTQRSSETRLRAKPATPPKRARRAESKRKTELPEPWVPSSRSLELLEAEGVSSRQALAVVPEFVDYWRSERGLKADWDAAFRGRVRYLHSQKRLPSPPDMVRTSAPVEWAPMPIKDALPPEETQTKVRDLFDGLKAAKRVPEEAKSGKR